MKDKLQTLREMWTSGYEEGLKELQEAISAYSRESNDETYGKVMMAFFLAAKDAKAAFCPVASIDPEKGTMIPATVQTSAGKSYVICTSPEEAALCPEEVIVLIGMDVLVAKAADDSVLNGICLNPYGDHPCLIPKSYIRRVLGMG